MTEKQLSKNQKYEADKKAAGFQKITIWVPVGACADFKSMASYCVENDDCVPFMVREQSTGKMRKGV